jgi:hypothetical protein
VIHSTRILKNEIDLIAAEERKNEIITAIA